MFKRFSFFIVFLALLICSSAYATNIYDVNSHELTIKGINILQNGGMADVVIEVKGDNTTCNLGNVCVDKGLPDAFILKNINYQYSTLTDVPSFFDPSTNKLTTGINVFKALPLNTTTDTSNGSDGQNIPVDDPYGSFQIPHLSQYYDVTFLISQDSTTGDLIFTAVPNDPPPSSGIPGPTGPIGPQGIQGPIGPKGADSNVPGPVGPQGLIGLTGLQGIPGIQGIQGIQGVAGATGPIGLTGADGAQGVAGPPINFKGPYSATATYAIGDGVEFGGSSYVSMVADNIGNQPDLLNQWALLAKKGDVGTQGLQGIQGPIGLTGLTGAQGIQGIQGIPGSVGATGATGSAGAVGPQGPPVNFRGAYNAGTTYIIGDAVSYNGSSWISMVNANTGNQPDVNPSQWGLLAQKGDIGATGAQGPIGNTGLTGATGAVGPAGAQGPIGLTGPAGPQGPVGLTGATGATGPQGPIGLTGPVGPQGPAGAAGAQGIQGPIGDTGPAGPQGIQGIPGVGGSVAYNNIKIVATTGGDYDNIPAAINASFGATGWCNNTGNSFSAGETHCLIKVMPGTFYVPATINTIIPSLPSDALTIQGSGPGVTILQATSSLASVANRGNVCNTDGCVLRATKVSDLTIEVPSSVNYASGFIGGLKATYVDNVEIKIASTGGATNIGYIQPSGIANAVVRNSTITASNGTNNFGIVSWGQNDIYDGLIVTATGGTNSYAFYAASGGETNQIKNSRLVASGGTNNAAIFNDGGIINIYNSYLSGTGGNGYGIQGINSGMVAVYGVKAVNSTIVGSTNSLYGNGGDPFNIGGCELNGTASWVGTSSSCVNTYNNSFVSLNNLCQ